MGINRHLVTVCWYRPAILAATSRCLVVENQKINDNAASYRQSMRSAFQGPRLVLVYYRSVDLRPLWSCIVLDLYYDIVGRYRDYFLGLDT
jgi:hypothetical protein